MNHLFRVRFKADGVLMDERWAEDITHLERHLLIGPSGRVFWMQWDGLNEITDEVDIIWTEVKTP